MLDRTTAVFDPNSNCASLSQGIHELVDMSGACRYMSTLNMQLLACFT